jgi:hypothetical protein
MNQTKKSNTGGFYLPDHCVEALRYDIIKEVFFVPIGEHKPIDVIARERGVDINLDK